MNSVSLLEGITISTLVTGVFGLWRYTQEFRETRKWKQAQFLLELNDKFFLSTEIRSCIAKLDNKVELQELSKIFELDRSVLHQEQIQKLEEFRRLFQFFDGLYYCTQLKVLTIEQINLFGWFLIKLREVESLREYCERAGFQNVVRLADKLNRYIHSSQYERLSRKT